LTHDFSYDSQYRLTETLVTNGSSSTERQTMYAFDGVGNRLTVMDDSCPGSYTMDSASPEPADQQMNQYTTTPCVGSIAWDQNGNEINRNGSDLMSRDYRDQLVQHSRIGGATTAYAYDALGRAISKHQGGTTGTWYYFAGTDPVEERDALDQVTVEYVRGPASDIVEMIQLGNPLFFFCDDLGSTRAVTDGAGNVLERYEYEDYGKPVFLDPSGTPAASSVIGNQYLFTGYRYDDESSFYYAKARHFDPQAGRFLGRDPLGIWGDSLNVGNGYTYVGNNPQTLVDPTGMYSDNVTCGGEFARNVFWDREDCSSSRKAGIEAGLCKAMNGAGAGDRAARIWTTYEMNGYPGGWSFLVGAAFGKWFAGPDFVVGKLWSLLIGATMSDIWKPFKNFTVFPIECESVSDPFNACGPNTVAYVHSSDSDIHLCTMWHSMAVDRRASVFLHELAHAEADAEDHFYYTTWGDPTKITTLSFPNIAETPILATNADTYGQMYLEFFLK
jgi:RHS repeat-associated protein